jgi:hypothetical protein
MSKRKIPKGLVIQLAEAFSAADWTPDDVQTLLEGDRLELLRDEVRRKALILRVASPQAAEETQPNPTIVELGEFQANYDLSMPEKLSANPKRIDWLHKECFNGKNFPTDRSGRKSFRAIAVTFSRLILDTELKSWCENNGKILAGPSEGVDLFLSWDGNAPNEVLPLMFPGHHGDDASGGRRFQYMHLAENKRHLDIITIEREQPLHTFWWFLVLEDVPKKHSR